MELSVLNIEGKKIREIEFLPSFKDLETIDSTLVHECVVCYLNNQRKGNASTKTRGEVSGGGNKPWKQKGTGRARAGSNRSPIWRHGGVTFGPHKRDYYYSLPKKKRRLGFVYSLLLKNHSDSLMALDSFLEQGIKKTKEVNFLLKNLMLDSNKKKRLFVLSKKEKDFILATNNIPNLDYVYVDNINVYDVMLHDNIIFDVNSIEYLNQKFKKED